MISWFMQLCFLSTDPEVRDMGVTYAMSTTITACPVLLVIMLLLSSTQKSYVSFNKFGSFCFIWVFSRTKMCVAALFPRKPQHLLAFLTIIRLRNRLYMYPMKTNKKIKQYVVLLLFLQEMKLHKNITKETFFKL